VPPAPATLSELVDQLGRTYSPFERLKILGRAWGLLRKMSPQERMTIAAQLGLDHADEVVESIAKRSGTQASPALISMIERAQLKGTPHLPQLLADLRDPGKRAERLRQGAAVLEGALAGEAAAPNPAVPARPAASPQPPPPPPRVAAPPPNPGPLLPMEAMPSPPPRIAPAVAEPAPPALPEPSATPPLQPAPAVPAPPPVVVAPVSPPAPVAAKAPEPPAAPPPKPQPEAAPVPAEEIELPGPLTARFRQLRRSAAGAEGFSASRLRALVEGFPDGWARRRALLELLRAGAAPALRDALSLVEALSSERDRLWCLGALAASRKVSGDDRDAFLAAVTSPTARRRLERRLGE
jgi:hypothetical protein